MKNEFEVRGDHAVIFLQDVDGVRLETLISIEDLARVRKFNGRWCGRWQPGAWSWYAYGNPSNGGNKRVSLARFVMNTPPELTVDHIHHVTLDNRRSELRNVPFVVNSKNKRLGDVFWCAERSHWRALYLTNGTLRHLGYFGTEEEARSAQNKAKRIGLLMSAVAQRRALHSNDKPGVSNV